MKTISDVSKIIDSLHQTPKYSATGYPMVRVQDIKNDFLDLKDALYVDEESYASHIKNHKPKRGDIVITRVGSYGMLALVENDDDFCLGQNIAIISPLENSHFLYYYLKSPYIQSYIFGNTGGSAYKSLSLERIRSLPYITPISDPKLAGEILYKIDKKIELNRRENAELEQMARTLYDYWFVQFDFPDAEGKPYKTSGGPMKFSPELNRPIPTDWEVKNLLDIVEWIGGAQPPKSTFRYEPAEGYVRFIQNRDYANDSNLTYIPIRRSNKMCDEMDIMMDKYGDAGLTRYGLSGAYNVALARIKVNLDDGQEFVRKFLESEPVYMYLNNACMASTRASMNEEILGNLNLAVPPAESELLKRFEKEQKTIIEKILANRQQSQNLSRLRDWLLPMLMNGQVSVE